jgi:hypothetical protein
MEKPASEVRSTGAASENGWSRIEDIFPPLKTRVEKAKTVDGTTKTVVKAIKTLVSVTETALIQKTHQRLRRPDRVANSASEYLHILVASDAGL